MSVHQIMVDKLRIDKYHIDMERLFEIIPYIQQYYAGLTGAGNFQFGKMNNGFQELYESSSPVCDSYQAFNMTVNANQNKFTFYVNDKMITSYTDNSNAYLSGSVGLRGYISTGLYNNLYINFM